MLLAGGKRGDGAISCVREIEALRVVKPDLTGC
jgi:hypothetical protein